MEGSFKEGKIDGYTKFYEKDGKIKYEGYFIKGEPLDKLVKVDKESANKEPKTEETKKE